MKKFLLIMAVAMCLVSCKKGHHGTDDDLVDEIVDEKTDEKADDFIDVFKDVDPTTLAVLTRPATFNTTIKQLVDNKMAYNSKDTTVQEIVFLTQTDDSTGVVVSANESPYPIYASYEEATRTAYVKTKSRGFNVKDGYQLFLNFCGLKRLNASKLYTAECSVMISMFDGCKNLSELDVRGFKGENVISIEYMFNDCSKLASLDLSRFNATKVKDISCAFQGCYALESLDLSGIYTENVWKMSSTFAHCHSLKSLDLSGWSTQNVKNMLYMFGNCRKMEKLVLGRNFVVCDNKGSMCSSIGEEVDECNIVCTDSTKQALMVGTGLSENKIKWTIIE